MSWANHAHQVAGRDVQRQEAMEGEPHARISKIEPNTVMMPRASDHHQHHGRSGSRFSDRIPYSGLFPFAGLQQDSKFAVEELAAAPAAMNASASSMMEGTGHLGSYPLPSSLDMQHFDDSASVDLQQLFPPPGGGTVSALNPVPPGYFVSQSMAADHAMGHVDQFSDSGAYHSYQSANDEAHMMVPFPFGAPQSSFDEHEETGMQDDASASNLEEMHEVSQLFNTNASLMTPPTSMLTPRTAMVSPIHAYGATRSLLSSELQDDEAINSDGSRRFSPDRRKLCCVEGCKSQARAFNRCKRHGGSKRCSFAGCTKSVQSRGLCIRHGGGSRCQEPGCTRAAQSHGKCKMHGGGRPCVVPDCDKKAHLKRLCRKHGGGAKCSRPGCDKWAQRQGMCMTHSKHAVPAASSPTPTSKPSARALLHDDSII